MAIYMRDQVKLYAHIDKYNNYEQFSTELNINDIKLEMSWKCDNYVPTSPYQ